MSERRQQDRHLEVAVPPTGPKRGISVMVTAMNEEGNLEPTVANIIAAVAPRFSDYEILVMEDGSRDRTPEIADDLQRRNPRIIVHHAPVNRGLGYSYRTGIANASKPLMMWVAGNNIVSLKGMCDLCDQADTVDFVLGIMLSDVRTFSRRFISRTFARLMNLLFSLRLPYYTGPWIVRTDVIKRMRAISDGSMITPEVPVRLVRGGVSHVEVGYHPMPRTAGKTKTFRISNIVFVLRSIRRLFWDIRIAKRTQQLPTSTS